MKMLFKHLTWLCLALSVAACGSLPRGAAVEREILKGADAEDANFAVYPVTKEFLPTTKSWPHTGVPRLGWLGHSHGSNAQIIRAGDQLDVVVWDSGDNSLLTAPEQRVANLSGVRVSQNGTIFLPYVGKVKVSGRSPESARQMVQRMLESIVPSAQVQLSMTEGRANSIDLVSGVNNPGNIKMPDNNFSVLSAISAGGGVTRGFENAQVKLVRGHKIYGTSIDRLYANPKLDTRLKGGDKLIIEEDRRYFLSLGAAGKEAQHQFNRDHMTALDALSLIGGVNDTRADPKGILILRRYPASAIKSDSSGPSQQRVVFTLDLTNSDGLFSAGNFHIHSGDLVLATESPVVFARTIVGVIGSGFGILSTANAATN